MTWDWMNTREVAAYLRIKERKVYDLVARKQIPFSRVTGKLLFDKEEVDAWVARNMAARNPAGALAPPVVAGSHDPLLEWAIRDSACGLALLSGGSLDGLRRVANGQAAACGIHLRDPETRTYNVPAARQVLAGQDVVLLEWAKREQGLITAPGNPYGMREVSHVVLRGARLMPRQDDAGSQQLLLQLLQDVGYGLEDLKLTQHPARSEIDLAEAISRGEAEAGIGIRAVALEYRLGFVPFTEERFDLLVRRRDYFSRPFQALIEYTRLKRFTDRADDLSGYDVEDIWQVTWNGE